MILFCSLCRGPEFVVTPLVRKAVPYLNNSIREVIFVKVIVNMFLKYFKFITSSLVSHTVNKFKFNTRIFTVFSSNHFIERNHVTSQ